MKKHLPFLLLPLLMGPALAQTGVRKVKVTDLLRIKSISGVTLNNDASRLACTVTAIEPDPENKGEFRYLNQVWMSGTGDNAAPVQLTTKDGSSQPAWSPDGTRLAFVRLADHKPQIFLLSLLGGEAVQLTHYKYGAGTPKWSADGRKILFSSNISLREMLEDSLLDPQGGLPAWPYEKPGFDRNSNLAPNSARADADGNLDEIRAYLANNEKEKKAKVLDRLQFQEEATTSSEIFFNHFFLTDAWPAAAVTELTRGFYSYFGIDNVPGSNHFIFSGNMDPSQHPDRAQESSLYLLADGNTTLLAGAPGKRVGGFKVSPSGKWVIFDYGGTHITDIPQLALLPLNGSAAEMILIPFDRSRGNYTWSADEESVYCSAQSNGGAPLYKVHIPSGQVERLSGFDNGIVSFDVKGNTLVYAKTQVSDPFELYRADTLAKNETVLSSFNSWTRDRDLSTPEKHSFVNSKGKEVEYWEMKPAGYIPGQKYPLLLEIHGGPTAMWGPGETSMWHEFQYFCSQGYGVVYSNPRGSGGYGTEFLRANVEDWGTGPTSDVLTALDNTVAEGWADTSKLLITGGSYAGYLVSWIIGHDHRFKAACSQRGVYDLSTFFGEGNAWRLVPDFFGGYPWQPEAKKILDRESPITYVQNITTPYIMFHGENDLRTGTIQGEMLYKSLKVLGRPVEYVRHPGGTHELTRSGNNRQRIDQMLRTYEFFERWIHY